MSTKQTSRLDLDALRKPSTLREMLALLDAAEQDNPVAERTNWLDAELTFQVEDGHRNHESVHARAEYTWMPRSPANSRTSEPARLRFIVYLERNRLVSERSKK